MLHLTSQHPGIDSQAGRAARWGARHTLSLQSQGFDSPGRADGVHSQPQGLNSQAGKQGFNPQASKQGFNPQAAREHSQD